MSLKIGELFEIEGDDDAPQTAIVSQNDAVASNVADAALNIHSAENVTGETNGLTVEGKLQSLQAEMSISSRKFLATGKIGSLFSGLITCMLFTVIF